MTIRQKLENVLVNHGLWEREAKQVLDLAIQKSDPDKPGALETLTPMYGRWNDDVSGYPAVLLGAVLLPLREEAYRFIKQTKPMHFCLMILREQIGANIADQIDAELASVP